MGRLACVPIVLGELIRWNITERNGLMPVASLWLSLASVCVIWLTLKGVILMRSFDNSRTGKQKLRSSESVMIAAMKRVRSRAG